ncbi:hypothetical protein [Sulfitobacter sp.]|uniref:hypothetical protein n=1 Tax=Sulfitobacter sp. TaxID=1903071 RepID=UPI003565B266
MADSNLSDTQINFIEQFLKVKVVATADDPAEFVLDGEYVPDNPADVWLDAKGQVDATLSPLMSELAKSDDPNLTRIARFGLNGVTKGNNTALMAAILVFNSSAGAARAGSAKALGKEIDTYSEFLGSDPIVALCENNPFGHSMAIRAPLIKALNTMKTMIAA